MLQLLPITDKEKANTLRHLPTLAIDLGFSSKAKSCGLCFDQESEGKKEKFREAVQSTATWIKKVGECVLILEAPLSGAFSSGNPDARGDFERKDDHGKKSDRRWYVGAGGVMALAAIHFLRLLIAKAGKKAIKVHLLEGFASRDKKPSDHARVARDLYKAWCNSDPEIIGIEGETFSMLSLLRLKESANKCPAVLRLPDGR